MLKLFFENSNFRAYLCFRTFSSIGGGMFGMFMMWVIHVQYQNPIYTGLAGAMFSALAIVNFLIGPFVDRNNKVAIIRMACLAQFMVVSAVLAVSIGRTSSVWFMLPMIFIFSAASLLKNPAFTALLPKIVASEDLIIANALGSIVATFVGLGIGVFLFLAMRGASDFTIIFIANAAVLLLALITSMFMKRVEPKKNGSEENSSLKEYLGELKEGLTFVSRGAVVFLLFALLAWDFAASVAYVNLPMFAEVHTGEAAGYIILAALSMVGSMIGAFLSRILGPKFDVWKIIAGTMIAAGVTRILFVNVIADDFSRAIQIYILYIGLATTALMIFETLMQKLPPKEMVARVDTISTSLIGITSVFGALLGGILGSALPNVDYVFIIQGIAYITIGVFVCIPRCIRVLPKISEGEE